MFPGTQPYAMTSKKNCDSDAQGCAQLNGNHEVIAKPSRLFSSLNTLKPLRGTQRAQEAEEVRDEPKRVVPLGRRRGARREGRACRVRSPP